MGCHMESAVALCGRGSWLRGVAMEGQIGLKSPSFENRIVHLGSQILIKRKFEGDQIREILKWEPIAKVKNFKIWKVIHWVDGMLTKIDWTGKLAPNLKSKWVIDKLFLSVANLHTFENSGGIYANFPFFWVFSIGVCKLT